MRGQSEALSCRLAQLASSSNRQHKPAAELSLNRQHSMQRALSTCQVCSTRHLLAHAIELLQATHPPEMGGLHLGQYSTGYCLSCCATRAHRLAVTFLTSMAPMKLPESLTVNLTLPNAMRLRNSLIMMINTGPARGVLQCARRVCARNLHCNS